MSQTTGAPDPHEPRNGDDTSGEGTELTTTDEPNTFEPEEDPEAQAGHPS